jgi:hypothetical protein
MVNSGFQMNGQKGRKKGKRKKESRIKRKIIKGKRL